MGLFDDVLPKQPGTQQSSGLFDDVLPKQADADKPVGIVDAAVRGFKRSLPETKSLLYGALAAGGGLVGADGVRDWALDHYKDVQKNEIDPLANQHGIVDTVQGKGSVGEYVGDTLGNFAGQGLQSAAVALAGAAAGSEVPVVGNVAGAVGGLVAKKTVEGAIKKKVASMLEQGIAKDVAENAAAEAGSKLTRRIGTGTLAQTGMNVGQEVGTAYTGRADDAAEQGQQLNQGDAARAILAGIPAGLLDTVAEDVMGIRALHGVSGNKDIRKRVAAGIAQGMLTEGSTEAAQGFLERLGAGQSLGDKAAVLDYIENAAAGALGGGVFGAVGGIRRNTEHDHAGGHDAQADQAPPQALLGLPAPDGSPSYGTINVTPGGTAMTAQDRGEDPRVLSPMETAPNPAVTPGVRAADSSLNQQPGRQVLLDGSPVPDAANGPLSRAVAAGVDAGVVQTAPIEAVAQMHAEAAHAAATAPEGLAPTAATTVSEGGPSETTPRAPWINSDTGEMRSPTDGELKSYLHDAINAQSAQGVNRAAIEQNLWKLGVTRERTGEAWKQVVAERKTGLTAPADEAPSVHPDEAAATMAMQSATQQALDNRTTPADTAPASEVRQESAPVPESSATPSPAEPARAQAAVAQDATPVYDDSQEVLDGDITPPSGGAFEHKGAADLAAKRAGGDAKAVPVDGGWVVRTPKAEESQRFAPETGTLNVPRSEMPQVPAQSHGGLMRHLNAQGIAHETTTVNAADLKPTQDEFSPAKVEQAKQSTSDRAVIVSSDGHIIDGHHQALAAAEEGKPVKAIVLNAPVDQALEAVKNSPSATTEATRQQEASSASTDNATAIPATEAPPEQGSHAPALQSPEDIRNANIAAQERDAEIRRAERPNGDIGNPKRNGEPFKSAKAAQATLNTLPNKADYGVYALGGEFVLRPISKDTGIGALDKNWVDQKAHAARMDANAAQYEARATTKDSLAVGKPEAKEDPVTTERKRLGFPRVMRKADAVDALRKHAGLTKAKAINEFQSLDRAGLKEGTRYGDDIVRLIHEINAKDEQAPAAAALHVENGEATPATPAEIAHSAEVAERAPKVTMAQAKKDLMGQVDAAIKTAPEAENEPVISKPRTENGSKTWDITINRKLEGDLRVPTLRIVKRTKGFDLLHGRNVLDSFKTMSGASHEAVLRLLGAEWSDKKGAWDLSKQGQQDYITFDVEGDGTFKVLNNRQRLEAFRDQVDKNFKLTNNPKPAKASMSMAQKQRDAIMAEAETVDENSSVPATSSPDAEQFDSESFNKQRDEAISASREAGNTHLDKLPRNVEGMRGKSIYYVHDPKVRGVIRTVDNSGNVYVDWSDAYSAEKELASEVMDGKKKVFRSSLGSTDLKDYAVARNASQAKEASAKSEPSAPTASDPAAIITSQKDLFHRLLSGLASVSQYKAGWQELQANRAAILEHLNSLKKIDLVDMAGPRYKNDNKAEIAKGALLALENRYLLGRAVSYAISFDGRNARIDAMNDMVDKTIDADLAEYKKDRASAILEREQRAAGIADPKTLDDFDRAAYAAGSETKFTPEQRARYDALRADARRAQRDADAKRNATIQQVQAGDTGMSLVETKHTKHGHDLFVVRMDARVERDVYDRLNSAAKRLGGSYSSYRGHGAVPGFQFRTKDAAEQFMALREGNVDASGQQQARAEAKAENRAESLSEKAATLRARAEESLGRDRKDNTARRAAQAASAEAEARNNIALANTMDRLAAAIESGKAKMLAFVQHRSQVEMLERQLKALHWDNLRAQGVDWEKAQDAPITDGDIVNGVLPGFHLTRGDAAALARKLSGIRGGKQLGESLSKSIDYGDEYTKAVQKNPLTFMLGRNTGGIPAFATKREAETAIRNGHSSVRGALAIKVETLPGKEKWLAVRSPESAMEKNLWSPDFDKKVHINPSAAEKFISLVGIGSDSPIPYWWQSHLDTRKQFAKLGIEKNFEFREAMREYLAARQAPAGEDRVRKLERDLVGRKDVGNDFFPTPPAVVDRLVEQADIGPGMRVLEPSAGKGDIAVALRDAAENVTVDTGEMSSTLRDILEAKGFDAKPGDFLEHQAEPVYDRIVMNPPFGNDSGASHVRHAYDMLKPGGRLVAVMGEGARGREEFEKWLESVGGVSEPLPAGSFKSSFRPTGVATKVVVIDKGAAAFSRTDGATLPASGIPRGLPLEKDNADGQRLSEQLAGYGHVPPAFAAVRADSLPNALRRALDSVGSVLGIRPVVIRNLNAERSGLTFNGVMFRDGVVYLDESSSHPVTTVAGHEFVHNLRQERPDLYAQLEAEVVRQGRIPEYLSRLNENDRAMGGDGKLSAGIGIEELTADAVGDALTDPKFLSAMAQRNPSKFKQLADAFLRFLDTMLGRVRDLGSNKYLSDVQAFRDVLADVLDRYVPDGTTGASEDASFNAKAATFHSAALRAVEEGKGAPKKADAGAWIDITPAMREAALGGQPLFSRAIDGRGAVTIEHNGETFAKRGDTYYLTDGSGEPRDFRRADAERVAKQVGGVATKDDNAPTWSVTLPGHVARSEEAATPMFSRKDAGLRDTVYGAPDGFVSEPIPAPKPGERWYHGREQGADRQFVPGRVAFLTRDRKAAEWFTHGGGDVTAHTVDAGNPARVRDLQDVLKAQGYDVMGDGTDPALAERIAASSPYDGTNLTDAIYVPAVRNELQRRGFDSLLISDPLENGDHEVLVVWDPARIDPKTDEAISNGGPMFSRKDAGEALHSSLANALNSARDVRLPADYLLGDLLSNGNDGTLNWWHKSVGTMFNLAKKNPLFARVYNSIQNQITDTSHYANSAMDLAPSLLPKFDSLKDIGKKPISGQDSKKVSDAVFDGTLRYTRDENGKVVATDDVDAAGVRWTEDELRQRYGMNDAQIGYYDQARRAINKSLSDAAIASMIRLTDEDTFGVREEALAAGTARKAAIVLRDNLMDQAKEEPKRAPVLNEAARQVMAMAEQVERLQDRGYAPLSRFGEHTVYVTGDGIEPVFQMFESRAEANRAARALAKAYPGANIERGTLSNEAFQQFRGMTPETLELFGDILGLSTTGDEAKDKAFQAFLQAAKANRSAMKRLIHREGIEGFSTDIPRVLANFIYSNARLTAANLNAPETARAIAAIPKEQGQLKDAAIQLDGYITNPHESAAKIGSFNFAQYLGGSIASAMVNMTQPLTMTFPWLSQYGGAWAAAKALKDAGVMAARDKPTGDQRLDDALKRAASDGITQPQEVHQLQSYASGKGRLRAGDGTKAGDAAAKAYNAWAIPMLAWGVPFALAEQYNRKMTFIAAFNMARDQGMSDPYGFAKDAVETTQGVYNKANKPAWARSTLGGMAFTFKQYSINYVEMLHRMWNQGTPGSPERRAGRQGVMHAMVVMALLSGASGLPGADDLDDLLDGLLQRLGFNFNTKVAREQFFAKIVGESGAKFLEHGMSAIPGMPIDVSGRLGMGNLIPATGLFTKKKDHTQDVLELVGPSGDFAARTFQAADALTSGDVGTAIQSIIPRALANAWQGIDMIHKGYYADSKGRKVLPTDLFDAGSKFIGFQPTNVANVQHAGAVAQQMVDFNRLKESEIADMFAQAAMSHDPGDLEDARNALRTWNSRNPDTPIRISPSQIKSRVQNMMASKADRLAKAAPKELRQRVRETLSGANGG